MGPVLILAGSGSDRKRFKSTQATLLVDDLDAFHERLVALGARITDEPKDVPTGRNMRASHPDGAVIEYVQHVSDGR